MFHPYERRLSMMIVITGATGFIGRVLCRRFLENGHTVIAVSRSAEKGSRVLGSDVSVVEWDDLKPDAGAKHVDGADAIVHLAGEPIGPGLWTTSKKRRIRESRIFSGKAVADAVEKARRKPRVVVQASAVGFYGDRGDVLCAEASSPGSDFLSSVVQEWEHATDRLMSCGVRRILIRMGLVLGRGEGILPYYLLPFRFFIGGPLGSGKQWLSWIHVEDVARAIGFLLEHEKSEGVFNLTSPVPIKNKDFSRAMGEALHRPSWLRVPTSLIHLLFGEMGDTLLLSGQRVSPGRLIETGFEFRYPDVRSALHEIIMGTE